MNSFIDHNMARRQVGNVQLAYVEQGIGEPIIFIHGSWDDHHSWDKVAHILKDSYRVVLFDRRGHSASTNGTGQGSIYHDVEDVVGLMDMLGIPSAHIVGHSYGANIAIALCERAPERIKSIFIHEPPIFSMLSGTRRLEEIKSEYFGYMKRAASLIEIGEVERAAKLFIEDVAFGKDAWVELFDECARQSILSNVDTWLDQFNDPDRLAVDVEALNILDGRVTISAGTMSLEPYGIVINRIAQINDNIKIVKIKGAGHGAHISHPDEMAMMIVNHLKIMG